MTGCSVLKTMGPAVPARCGTQPSWRDHRCAARSPSPSLDGELAPCERVRKETPSWVRSGSASRASAEMAVRTSTSGAGAAAAAAVAADLYPLSCCAAKGRGASEPRDSDSDAWRSAPAGVVPASAAASTGDALQPLHRRGPLRFGAQAPQTHSPHRRLRRLDRGHMERIRFTACNFRDVDCMCTGRATQSRTPRHDNDDAPVVWPGPPGEARRAQHTSCSIWWLGGHVHRFRAARHSVASASQKVAAPLMFNTKREHGDGVLLLPSTNLQNMGRRGGAALVYSPRAVRRRAARCGHGIAAHGCCCCCCNALARGSHQSDRRPPTRAAQRMGRCGD